MKSRYVRALCLGVAGTIAISAAAIGNGISDKKVQNTSITAEAAESDASLTAGIASVTAVALSTDSQAAVSDTGISLTAAGQEETEQPVEAESVAETEAVTEEEAVPEAEAAAEENAEAVSEPTTIYGYQNLGIAVVDGNLNVREAASTDASVVGKMPNKAACEILGTEGEWTKITSGEVSGYVKSEYLVTGDEAAALAEEVVETVAKVTTTTLYVREEPNTDCSIMTAMPIGEELEVLEQLDGWVKVNVDSDEGYVSADYVEISTELPTAMTMTEIRYGQGVSDVRVDLVSYACQFVGNPYVWGGTSLTRGADCSGFVMSVFAQYGVSLPHSSVSQAGCGTSISSSEAQPGDLFFYGNGKRINHVAIYIGNGQVVHASSPKSGIKISGAYYRNPVKVVRVLSN